MKRPRTFCRPTGCSKLGDNLEEIDDLVSIALRESTIEEELSEKVEKATTKVSGELRALADQAEDSQVKEVLKLVAELIEKEGGGLEDREIVLLEDLKLDE